MFDNLKIYKIVFKGYRGEERQRLHVRSQR